MSGRIELTLSVSVVVAVVVESEGLAECAEVRALLNSTKNGSGAIAFGMGTAGSLTVVVSGVPGGNVNVGSEASKDVIV